MSTYFARWPVLDQDVHLSDVTHQALEDLAEQLEAAGLVAVDAPVWSFESADLATLSSTTVEEHVELHAAVRVLRFRPEARTA